MIYTHDEATRFISEFESILSEYDIHIPSPEDDDREPDDMVGLYGSTYDQLLNTIEEYIIDILDRRDNGDEVVKYEYSGTM